MGSYAFLTIGNYPIFSSKNYYNRWYFRRADRVQRTRSKGQRNPLIWSAVAPHLAQEEEVDYRYVVSAATLRRRLALAGFNRETLEREFRDCIASCRSDLEERVHSDELWATQSAYQLSLLRKATLADWLGSLKTAVRDGIVEWRWDELKLGYSDPLLHLMLEHKEYGNNLPEHETGFPCRTLESMAVAVLEVLPDDVECALDVTDLINGGWTNSFEDVIEYHKEFTTFYEVFATAMADIHSLMEVSPGNPTLARLLFANVITAMETYLSDTFKKQVLTREAIRRRFVQTHDAFKEKIAVQDLFRKLGSLNEDIVKLVDAMSFHNLDKTISLYRGVLDTQFPDDQIAELMRAVETRHDIVHRNGKTTLGSPVVISMAQVTDLVVLVEATVRFIDKQIKDGLLDDVDDED